MRHLRSRVLTLCLALLFVSAIPASAQTVPLHTQQEYYVFAPYISLARTDFDVRIRKNCDGPDPSDLFPTTSPVVIDFGYRRIVYDVFVYDSIGKQLTLNLLAYGDTTIYPAETITESPAVKHVVVIGAGQCPNEEPLERGDYQLDVLIDGVVDNSFLVQIQ